MDHGRHPKLALEGNVHGKKKQSYKEKMAGWDKGWLGVTQHDDPGSYTNCTRLSHLEKDHKVAAVACLSSIAKAISQVHSNSGLYSCISISVYTQLNNKTYPLTPDLDWYQYPHLYILYRLLDSRNLYKQMGLCVCVCVQYLQFSKINETIIWVFWVIQYIIFLNVLVPVS